MAFRLSLGRALLRSFSAAWSVSHPGPRRVRCWPFKGLGKPEQQEIQTASLGSSELSTVISALKTKQGKAGGAAPPQSWLPLVWPVSTQSEAAGIRAPPCKPPHPKLLKPAAHCPGQESEPKLLGSRRLGQLFPSGEMEAPGTCTGASPLLQPGGSLSIASSTCSENALMGAGSWVGLLQRERGTPGNPGQEGPLRRREEACSVVLPLRISVIL